MASCYPAQIYGLSRLGALSAGYQADIVVLNSFLNTDICEVYCKGQPAGKNPGFSPVPEDIFHTVHIGPICGEDLCLPLHRCETPVAEVIPGQINTRLVYEKVFSKNGCFEPGGPYRKVAVVERHRATGNVGLGIIKGLPVKGAVATTVAHDSHNVVVVGDNDEDMLLAIWELERCEGGYTIVRRGKVLETLPLPIGGLMSSRSACEVAKQLEKMKEIFADMGIPEEIDSFHAMSFLTLPVLPEARITDRGMFDAVRFEYITL